MKQEFSKVRVIRRSEPRMYMRGFSARHLLALAIIFIATMSTTAHADPTQEDVFRSISDNMGHKTDNSKFMAGFAAAAATVILIAVLSNRKQRAPRAVKTKSASNSGKLMKEIIKTTSLKKAEIRYLKTLAERESVGSPLTLLICPSVLMKAAKTSTTRAEKKVLGQIVRKMGIVSVAAQARRAEMRAAKAA